MQEQNQLLESISKLTINCNQDSQDNLQSFSNKISNSTHPAQYSLSIRNCQHQNLKQIEKVLASNSDIRITQLLLQNVSFGEKRLNLFNCFKLENLHTLKISIKNFSKEIPSLLIESWRNSVFHILHEISHQAISLICNANWTKLQQVHLKVKKNFSSALRRIGKAEWKNLIRLNVCGSQLSDQMKNIGKFFDFPNLKQICLNDFTEEVITKIDKAKQPLLEVLDLRHCPVSGVWLFNSQHNVGWQELKELYMGSGKIKKQEICSGLFNICIYSFPKLIKFSINSSQLTKQAMKHFKKAEWKQLKQLQIYDCEVNGENLQVFNKCDWKKLKQIKLSNLTTDSSIESLPSANWPELAIINLYETDITTLGTMVFGKLREQEMKTICLDFDQRQKLPNSMKELFSMIF